MKLLAVLIFFSFLIIGCISTNEIFVNVSVVDDFGIPVNAARITFIPANSNLASNIFNTGVEGKVNINIISEKYNISVSKEGHYSAILENYDLNNDTSSLAFNLEKIR